ncbi:MAG: hypothetical protein ACXVJC_23180 [Mucilaginibacter sp.]
MITGLIAGLLLPGFTWFIFGYLLKNHFVIRDKPLIPYLVALALNLLAIKILFKKGVDQTGSGMILSTFAAMLICYFFQNYLR